MTTDDVTVSEGWISVKSIGRVGLWWQFYDKKVCLSYGFGESFTADTEEAVKEGILKILNKKHE